MKSNDRFGINLKMELIQKFYRTLIILHQIGLIANLDSTLTGIYEDVSPMDCCPSDSRLFLWIYRRHVCQKPVDMPFLPSSYSRRALFSVNVYTLPREKSLAHIVELYGEGNGLPSVRTERLDISVLLYLPFRSLHAAVLCELQLHNVCVP